MKSLIMQFFPISCHFVCLVQTQIDRDQVSHTSKTMGKIHVVHHLIFI